MNRFAPTPLDPTLAAVDPDIQHQDFYVMVSDWATFVQVL